MFAEVRLPGGGAEVLTVPGAAVFLKEGKHFVYVIENGVAKKIEVSTGNSDGENIAITSGLNEGAEVVVSGVEDLQDGVKVAVKSTSG
jgi:hypothetical protein